MSIGASQPSFLGETAPRCVDTKAEFLAIKDQSVEMGNVKTFENFILDLPEEVKPDQYTTAVVWSERFAALIRAGTDR